MNNSLVVDIVYPNKYSRWRNLEINFFISEFKSDILIFKIDSFANIDFNFDYEFCNESVDNLLSEYNILIFDPRYNCLNKYNTRIDGTTFNHKYKGSYLLTRNTDFTIDNYTFVYHIFQHCYLKFNNSYNFDFQKQYLHLYPGGGFLGRNSDLSMIHKDVKLITTHPLTTSLVKQQNNRKSIEVMIGPMFEKDELVINKKINEGQITVCFSSMGHDNDKGANEYLRIVNEYKTKYPYDNIRFISIGNCGKDINIVSFDPMDYKQLQDFYYNNVDIYLNLDTGVGFNGWPLGMESLKSGSVLITTDKLNVSKYYNLSNDPFFVTNNLSDFVSIIKKLHDDRNLLEKKSKECQNFVYGYTSYETQQLKIKKFIIDNL
jgi:hypothetical protein